MGLGKTAVLLPPTIDFDRITNWLEPEPKPVVIDPHSCPHRPPLAAPVPPRSSPEAREGEPRKAGGLGGRGPRCGWVGGKGREGEGQGEGDRTFWHTITSVFDKN